MSFQPRILIADDDTVSRQLIERMLESYGLERVTSVDNGFAAWREIQRSLEHKDPFALVITDWRMPEYDGMRLLTAIRQHETTARIPVIMQTGKHERSEVAQALKQNVNDYIVKPVARETLQAKIEKVLKIKLPVVRTQARTGTK